MKVIITEKDATKHVQLSGRLDTSTAPDFEVQIQPIYDGENPQIVLDCAEMAYISSSGLRTFLTLQKNITAKNGKLVVKNLSEEIKEIFEMTGFSALFVIE